MEGQSRQQRIQELEATLTRERQAAGDLASLTQRLDAAGADLAKAEQARAEAETRTGELASTHHGRRAALGRLQQQLTDAQQRQAQSQQQLADLQSQNEQAQQTLATRQEDITKAESAGARAKELEARATELAAAVAARRAAGQVADR